MKRAAARTAMMTASGLERVVLPALGGAPVDVGSAVDVPDVDDLLVVEVLTVEAEVAVVFAEVEAAEVVSIEDEDSEVVEASALVLLAAEVVEVAAEETEEEATTSDSTENLSE
jgi:hypothetical protein